MTNPQSKRALWQSNSTYEPGQFVCTTRIIHGAMRANNAVRMAKLAHDATATLNKYLARADPFGGTM